MLSWTFRASCLLEKILYYWIQILTEYYQFPSVLVKIFILALIYYCTLYLTFFFLLGDYNLDGYPDLLVITSNNKGSHATLLESILCTNRKCSTSAVASQKRTFVKVNDGAQPLNDINNAKNAAFLDLDEDVKRILIFHFFNL
jgi:hypothetical protein